MYLYGRLLLKLFLLAALAVLIALSFLHFTIFIGDIYILRRQTGLEERIKSLPEWG
jgi:hypothetical protein